jgi:cytochrome P450
MLLVVVDTDGKWAANASQAAIVEGAEGTSLINVLIGAGLTEGEAVSEAKENLGPGTDTTSATLAHILWAISHDVRLQSQLYAQLDSRGFPQRLEDLETIPLLSACVKEGIRWAGAAAAVMPRVVPQSGAELLGVYLPPGVSRALLSFRNTCVDPQTIISTSPIWYLRDPIAFPDPMTFDPFRWVSDDGSRLISNALRDRYYIPFSKGANVCIGSK